MCSSWLRREMLLFALDLLAFSGFRRLGGSPQTATARQPSILILFCVGIGGPLNMVTLPLIFPDALKRHVYKYTYIYIYIC